jgi:transcriptional regulator with PAS, ATPase and Fis domain
MPAPRKRLFIFSLDRRVNKFLCNIVHNIIGREVAIAGASLEDEAVDFQGADVVMTSGSSLLLEARRRFAGCPIIAPRRIITGYNLEKVLLLPRGTDALVVNHPREATAETIASLRNLGLTHLTYIPYWQRRPLTGALRRVTTAISPGMGHLCPEHVRQHIDIGPRLIGMGSFARLLLALDLDLAYLERYADTYHHFLMESSRKLADALGHTEMLAKRNEVILDEFDEALVSVNPQGHIDRANRAAQRLLAPDGAEILQRPLAAVLAGFEKVADLLEAASPADKSASIFNLRGKQLVVSKIPVISGKATTHLFTFREIAGIQRLEKDVRVKLARRGYLTKYDFGDIWGASPGLQAAVDRARRFARTDKTIVITGESGTGKELFAHAIHCHSLRREGPFVAVNFAGLSESLIESELFGYEEGAFTGAKRGGKAGLFEQAHGGTIFLDEIGDASPGVQSRLLRVLQERELLRVGGSKIVPVDVRVVAATNRDLRQAMAQGRFREDLFYRLSALPLDIPPLRERPEDILPIFQRYLQDQYRVQKPLTPAVAAHLTRYAWPGNVRELMNTADFAFIASEGHRRIDRSHLPAMLRRAAAQASPAPGALEFQALAGRLEARQRPGHLTAAVLGMLAANTPQGLGRNRLCRELAARRMPITEGRMKSLLAGLREEGLLAVGATKQGTAITPRGMAFLEHLRRPREGGGI